MKRARARIKDLTDRRQVGRELEDIIGDLNRFLRGWGNYFRTVTRLTSSSHWTGTSRGG